jgi:dTDP-4-amino-4,6-dideoxygalactose transaminase/glycosyltransferase involved in cell wall biosynthesis
VSGFQAPVNPSEARRLTVRIAPEAIPRLPVFGWAAYRGGQRSDTPCLLDSPGLLFTTSGRAAIALALKALGVGSGDRVLVPTYHCPTMVAPAVHVGARPVFYPLRSSGADLAFLTALDLTHVRALIATHYFGLPQPMSELRSFCDRHGIALIEDCAHALFGVSDGRRIGTWGDFAIASLTKFFSVPEGGCLIVNRPGLAIPRLARRSAKDQIKSLIDVLELGVRYRRMPGLNDALGFLFALRRRPRAGGALGLEPVDVDLEEGDEAVDEFDSEHAHARLAYPARLVVRSVSWSRIVRRRREHYRLLAERFAGIRGARVPWPSLPDSAVPYVFPLWVDEPDGAYYAFKATGVPVFRWDRLWAGTPFLPGDEGYSWSRHILQFPCHQELSTADLDWLVGKIRDVLGGKRAPAAPVRSAAPAVARGTGSGNRVLMIAFHFPPLAGSSGIQRTLRFAQHLPALGWQPIVLTAHPRAYETTSDDLAADIPREAIVRRAFALDASRHLAIRGRYPAIAARPDRWISWWLGAVPEGLRLIRQYRPDVIWSTYPIATAHAIGATLARRSGLPWIADFRDPMAQEGYPADPLTWRRFAAIEARAIREAALSVFAAPGAARMYRERYPDVAAERLRVIPNGYDDETFAAAAARLVGRRRPLVEGRITLLHSGIVYPSERDPVPLFTALRRLVDRGAIDPEGVRVRFRAPGHDAYLARLVAEHRLESLIEIAPSVPYREAIEEMLLADALLILQASNCNDQVPAKLYEYARAGRPVLALTDPAGDTAAGMRSFGLDAIAPLDSVEGIERALPAFLAAVKSGTARRPERRAVAAASRRARSQELLALLEEVSTRSLVRQDGP